MEKRHSYDFYETPRYVVEQALELISNSPLIILDPCAGNGIWGKVVREKWGKYIEIIGVELQNIKQPYGYDRWFNQDYFEWVNKNKDYYKYRFDLIIGNPPYSLAEQFICTSMDLLDKNKQLLFLLRLAFLEGQKRGDGLWKEYPPKHIAVLSKRPSFTCNGKTDATAYAIYLWQKGWKEKPTLSWLR